MNTYKALLQYKGTHFFGWQIQPRGTKTIQGELNRALSKIHSGKKASFRTLGSGRTDAGVHAIGQVVKIEMELNLPVDALKSALNSLLPSTIRVLQLESCLEDFHPIFHAAKKEYWYLFNTNIMEDPFKSELMTYLQMDLDIDLMNQACKILEGTHDFQNYFCTGTPVKSTVREIYSCSIIENDKDSLVNDGYCLKIVGSGFLKQMVRLIMGTLLNIGQKRISLDQFKESLQISVKGKLGPVAPPQGLYLYSVTYSNCEDDH